MVACMHFVLQCFVTASFVCTSVSMISQELTNILWAMAKLTGGAPKGEEMQAFIACAPSAALQQLNDEGSVRKVGLVTQ